MQLRVENQLGWMRHAKVRAMPELIDSGAHSRTGTVSPLRRLCRHSSRSIGPLGRAPFNGFQSYSLL